MRCLVIAVSMLALGLLPHKAAAQSRASTLDGNKLLERCTSKDRPLAQGCEAYIQGVADTVSEYEGAAKAANVPQAANRICVPPQVTGVEMRDTVIRWLQAHPGDRNHQGGAITVHVLRDTWPCHG